MFIIDKLKKNYKKIEMNNYQKKIIKDTEKFRPIPMYPVYPPYHDGDYIEEHFFNYFIQNKNEFDRIYIPIYWTNIYNNITHDKELQGYLDSLDPDLKYFTVCQHERAPEEILPKNTLVFSGSGKIYEKKKSNNYIPIPLICSKIKNVNRDKERDIFCSFVGSDTHLIRRKLQEQLKDDVHYYFDMFKWQPDISKEKEEKFIDITERSVFTLCPRGDGPTSFRLYESMQLDSIPVYVYNVNWIPYQKELNWLDICIFIHEDEISHIKEILENIPQERIEFMKSKISEIYDDWFTLDSMCRKIYTRLNNEKTRLLTFYSDSHDVLFKNYLKPSVDKINEYDLIPQRYEQIGTGSFMDKGWKDSMLKKLEFIVQTIDECWGDCFVFADADIIFIDKSKDFLLSELDKNDVVFQRDLDDLCAGFFMMKSNKNTLHFIEECIKKYEQYPEDQTAMRENTNLIKYKLLPDEIFNISMINGGKVWDGETYTIPKNILVFHANWSIGIKAKIDLFNLVIDDLIKTKDLSFMKRKNDDVSFYRFDDGSIFVGNVQSGRMMNGHYLKEENEILVPDNKNSNKKLKVNVYFNYFDARTEKRNKEIQFCLNKLISNKNVDKIYLLCSDKYTEWLDKKVVKIDMFNIQPTFSDIFNIVNFNTKLDDLNILLNSDCYIGEEDIQLVLNNIKHRMVYCLSRWNITNLEPFESEHYDISCSQDAWIFLGEIDNVIADFKMGVPGCDNAIAYEFDKKGYIVSNPSKDIKIYHYHFSDVRTYGVSHEEKERNRIKRPYKFIPSSFLNEETKDIPSVIDTIKTTTNFIPSQIVEKLSNMEKMKKYEFKENILNQFVDNVYCINLRKRKDKLTHMLEQFKKIDLDSFKIIRGVDGEKLKINDSNIKKGEVGCLRSHISILQDAIDRGYEKIAVFEDDIIFCDDFEKRFEYFSKNVPDDWEIMYLGVDLPPILTPVTMVKPMIFRVWKSKGCFAMILNNKNGLFQNIIDISKNEEKTIDTYIENLFPKIKSYVFLPTFVKLLDIKSDILDKDITSINMRFRETIELQKTTPEEKIIQPVQIIKTEREICEEYLKSPVQFIIRHGSNIVFDSVTTGRENVIFFDDHFEIYGRPFSYRGMAIIKK